MREKEQNEQGVLDKISSLTPNNISKDNELYIKLIDEAVCERDDTTNIALSGPYGAGKSTIINAYKKYNDKKASQRKKILNISMASFSEMSESSEICEEEIQSNEADEDGPKQEELSNKSVDIVTIEKTILQQMIYSVDKKTLPFSRFSRITNIKHEDIEKSIINFLIWGLSIAALLNIDCIKPLFESLPYHKFLYGGIIFIVSLFVFNMTIKNLTALAYYIRKINLSKIAFKNVELIFSKKDSSVLNSNIDEILYFFEATKTDVMIIEDLDRFKKPEIFVNLRELNNQINNSAQVSQKVTFLYAVKEDIFKNEDRVKFFDLIIPVIPFINSDNSYEILSKKIQELDLSEEIDEGFIFSIAIYISDMRLLTNIINEFIIYNNKLSNYSNKQKNSTLGLDAKKLLAMIIYKNFHPDDFTNLHKGTGDLYTLIRKTKNKLLKPQLDELNKNISNIDQMLQEVKKEKLKNKIELNKLLLFEVFSAMDVVSIRINNSSFHAISEIAINEELFQELLKINTNILSISHHHGQRNINIVEDIQVALKELDFEKRANQIINKEKSKYNELEREKNDLLQQRTILQNSSIGSLVLKNKDDAIIPKRVLECEALYFLVSRDYITDDYPLYISLVHDLSEVELEFIKHVRNNRETSAEIKLNNVASIVKKLSIDDYKSESILNIYLVQYLIEHVGKHEREYKTVLELFSKTSEKTNQFIYNFIQQKEFNIEYFLKTLVSAHPNLFTHISYVADKEVAPSSQVIFSVDFLALILKYIDYNMLIKLDEPTGYISNSLEQMSNFLEFVDIHKLDSQNLKKFLLQQDIKFESIDRANILQKDLFDFIYQNELYAINENNLKVIVEYLQNKEVRIEEAISYETLSTLKEHSIKKYIDSNIGIYVERVFLQIKHDEPLECVIDIVNNSNLHRKYVIPILNYLEEPIQNISQVDSSRWVELFESKKIEPTWNNVLALYEKVGSIEVQFDYLNDKDISMKLSESVLIDVVNEDYKDIVLNFSKELIFHPKLSLECLSEYTKAIKECWDDVPIKGLTAQRIEKLLEYGYICLTAENFDAIKSLEDNNSNLEIKLIEVNFQSFLSEFDYSELSNKDLESILNSTNIENSDKWIFYKKIDTSDISIGIELITYAFDNCSLESQEKIKIIINQSPYIDKKEILQLVAKIDDKYAKILSQKRFEVEDNELNKELANVLQEKGIVKKFTSMTGRKQGQLMILLSH